MRSLLAPVSVLLKTVRLVTTELGRIWPVVALINELSRTVTLFASFILVETPQSIKVQFPITTLSLLVTLIPSSEVPPSPVILLKLQLIATPSAPTLKPNPVQPSSTPSDPLTSVREEVILSPQLHAVPPPHVAPVPKVGSSSMVKPRPVVFVSLSGSSVSASGTSSSGVSVSPGVSIGVSCGSSSGSCSVVSSVSSSSADSSVGSSTGSCSVCSSSDGCSTGSSGTSTGSSPNTGSLGSSTGGSSSSGTGSAPKLGSCALITSRVFDVSPSISPLYTSIRSTV